MFSAKQIVPLHPPILKGQYQPKSKEKYMPFLHCISRFESTPLKICKIQPPDILFLVAFIIFYISRYHISQKSENVKWKGKNTKIWWNIKKWRTQVLCILCLFAIYYYTLFPQKHSVVFFEVSFSMVMKLPVLTSFFACNVYP